MAATALAATKELHVGLGLMPAAIRNPALAAMEIGALAWLHPGRFTAVFGHGVSSWMHQIGAAPSRRLAALGEVTSVVRALLAGETVTLAGDHVTLAGVTLERPPDIVPQILIGSTGPKGLALAGRSADGFLVAEGCGPTFVAWQSARPTKRSNLPRTSHTAPHTRGFGSTTTKTRPDRCSVRPSTSGSRQGCTRSRHAPAASSSPFAWRCPSRARQGDRGRW